MLGNRTLVIPTGLSLSESRLSVIRKLVRGHRTYFECLCSCGTVKIIRADNVKGWDNVVLRMLEQGNGVCEAEEIT